MKTILVTGGTVFVSRYAAVYFAQQGYRVYALNRGTRPQPSGVTLIQADRHALGNALRGLHFDAVLDITAYTAADVDQLMDALDEYGQYILLSSSAVYPETTAQPFSETAAVGPNRFWGQYGVGKIEAERAALRRDPHAMVLRPPYLYGPFNNVYREAFVFDCALQDRPFYLPGQGQLPLQFFHVEDLCRFIALLLNQPPREQIFNLGNPDTVTVRQWVELCYQLVGKQPVFVPVPSCVEQRSYFSFYDYAYRLDVERQRALLPAIKPLQQGLYESLQWYLQEPDAVIKKPFFAYIEQHLGSLRTP